MSQDAVFVDYSAKRPFGHQALYRGVYEAKLNGAPCIVMSVCDILSVGGVPPEQAPKVVKRFRDECVLLSKLRHPNIVQFLGVQVGTEASDVTLVLEYLHTNLDDCLRSHAGITLPTRLAILRDVSQGLLYLHSRAPPIVHGDLHTRNVLLTRDMVAKIVDLGTSKLLGYGAATGHLPPEALTALRDTPFLSDPDCKTDIFSFGVLCMLVASDTFVAQGEGEGKDALLTELQRRTEALKLLDHTHHLLHPLVRQCLHDDAERRPLARIVCAEMDGLCSKFPRDSKNILEVWLWGMMLHVLVQDVLV